MIVLAREPDIALGEVLVRPSAREVVFGDTAISLEPRVMQVLVALARPPHAVVSRDLLIERCWEGRIVGDDAITRCIVALRKLARSCGDAFEIETLSKVGYRLRISERPVAPRGGNSVAPEIIATSVAEDSTAAPDGMLASVAAGLRLRPKSVWVTAAVGVALIASVLVALFAADAFAPTADRWGWSVDDVRDFATTPAAEHQPVISPDGRLVAFSRGPSHHHNIFVQALNKSDALQITEDDQPLGAGVDKSAPVWSPDGTRIAYLIRPDDTPCIIAVQPFPKGPARQAGGCVGPTNGRLVWIPNGNLVIYVDRLAADEPFRLMVLDVDSGKSERLTDPPIGAGDSSASASPDGKLLMFVRDSQSHPLQLELLNLQTKTLRVVQTGAGFITGAWSADSKTIFFVQKDADDKLRLKAMRLSDGRTEDLYNFAGNLRAPMTGRDGMLALSFERAHFRFGFAPTAPGQVPEFVLTDADHVFKPSYSEQGDLAFGVSGAADVAVHIAERGKEAREVAAWSGALDDLKWSPDGSRVAIAINTLGRSQLRIVDKSSLAARTIDLDGHTVGQMSWLSSARILVPVLTEKWRLWFVDVGTGAASLAPYSDRAWDCVQVHGSAVYASRYGENGLWRLDGQERKVAAMPPFQFRNSAFERHWKVVGRDVLFAKFDEKALIAQPLNGEPSRVFTALPSMADAQEFDIDPMTHRTLYEIGPSDTDIMLLHVSAK